MTDIAYDVDLTVEFDRQVATLVDKGYPGLTGLPEADFVALLTPLREVVADLPGGRDRIPFVLVVTGLAREQAFARVDLRGRTGFTTMEPEDLAGFVPATDVDVPAARVYAAGRHRHGARHARRPTGRRDAEDPGRGAAPADPGRGHRRGHPPPRSARQRQPVLDARLALRRPTGDRDLGQPAPAEARLVLGRRPAHLAGLGLLREPSGLSTILGAPVYRACASEAAASPVCTGVPLRAVSSA